jgi:hypothetical protein
MSPRSRTLVPAVLLLVSACGAPAASAPASVQPSAAASAADLQRTGNALQPGRYTRAGFTPRITFEITDGEWYAEQQFTGFFDVQQEVGSPDVIAVQFAKPSEVYGEEGRSVRVETAEDAAAALRSHPALAIIGDSTSRIDGRDGIVLEVEHAGGTSGNVGIVTVPPGPLLIAPERRLWIAFFDTDDGLLAIMVGGSVARWVEALAAAEPILETVTIGR